MLTRVLGILTSVILTAWAATSSDGHVLLSHQPESLHKGSARRTVVVDDEGEAEFQDMLSNPEEASSRAVAEVNDVGEAEMHWIQPPVSNDGLVRRHKAQQDELLPQKAPQPGIVRSGTEQHDGDLADGVPQAFGTEIRISCSSLAELGREAIETKLKAALAAEGIDADATTEPDSMKVLKADGTIVSTEDYRKSPLGDKLPVTLALSWKKGHISSPILKSEGGVLPQIGAEVKAPDTEAQAAYSVGHLVQKSIGHLVQKYKSISVGHVIFIIISVVASIVAIPLLYQLLWNGTIGFSLGSAEDDTSRDRDDTETGDYVCQKAKTRMRGLAALTLREQKSIPPRVAPWIKKEFLNQKVGILVSDMSGSTRLTREHGPIHFASIIIRMRQICLPILHRHGASFIATEADDFIVVFPSAAAAVKAAHGMQKTVAKYNASLSMRREHFAITLNGIGVDFGPGPLVDKNGKLFGCTVSNAYSLGEELCKSGEVLVTGNVARELSQDDEFADATFEKVTRDVGMDAENSSKDAEVYVLHFDSDEALKHLAAPVDDSQYLHADLMQLTRRHDSSLGARNLKAMDKDIKDKYFVQQAVLMIEFDSSIDVDPEIQIALQYECLAQLSSILEKYKAQEVEEVLFLFPDSVSAVSAALEMREAVKAMMRSSEGPSARVKGYGIHEGNMLYMPNTDVHWGDPVNTASKLGQDLATDGELLVSDAVYHTVRKDVRMEDIQFDLMTMTKSNVTFNCYTVTKCGPMDLVHM